MEGLKKFAKNFFKIQKFKFKRERKVKEGEEKEKSEILKVRENKDLKVLLKFF